MTNMPNPPQKDAPQSEWDAYYMKRAYRLALKSYNEGGCPIGGVLVGPDNTIWGEGHNMRVQENNPIIHGEMSAMRAAGARSSYAGCTMVTTLSPCSMCAGTIKQFNIPRVVIGDVTNSAGNAEWLSKHGIKVVIMPHPECIALVQKFRTENPRLWSEDWGMEYKETVA